AMFTAGSLLLTTPSGNDDFRSRRSLFFSTSSSQLLSATGLSSRSMYRQAAFTIRSASTRETDEHRRILDPHPRGRGRGLKKMTTVASKFFNGLLSLRRYGRCIPWQILRLFYFVEFLIRFHLAPEIDNSTFISDMNSIPQKFFKNSPKYY
ncbi:hypothetical protein PMAYCL1PPCAC_05762, partial [Pristionchus mayeri]